MKIVVVGLLGAVLCAPLALAQTPPPAQATPASQPAPATWSGLSDRFQIDTGYFRLASDSVLRYNGPRGGSGEVNLENDLGLDDQVNTFWVDATWRVGRRHQLKLAFTRFNRDRRDYTLQRDFTWGGETYNAGLSANTSNNNSIVGGYYRFAIFRNDRFEIGPTLGIGYLKLEARIKATGTVGGPGGSESRTLDKGASIGSVTGAVGGYAEAWPARRFVRARRLPVHQGEARGLGGRGDRLAAGGRLLLLQERRRGRAVQVQPLQLRPRHPGERARRRGHVQGLPDLPVVPLLIRAARPHGHRGSNRGGRYPMARKKAADTGIVDCTEQKRLNEAREAGIPWKKWGPYLSERQWGTVREDYSADGNAWDYFTHDQSRSRAYRWGEDGLGGFSDDKQRLCFALALWNERDPILKERAVRPHQQRGEPRRGREGVLLLRRLDADPLVHEVPLQVPAARVPLPGPRRDEPAADEGGARVRAPRHGDLRRTTATSTSSSSTPRRDRTTS